MRIDGNGSGANWSLTPHQPKTTADVRVNDESISGAENLHGISHAQLLHIIETGRLSSSANASSGISISADGTWRAAPGTSFSSALFAIAEPPRIDAAGGNGSDIPGTIDLFRSVQNQIVFNQSMGDASGAQQYESLLNTLQSLTDPNGNLVYHIMKSLSAE